MNGKRIISPGVKAHRCLAPIVTILVGAALSFTGYTLALSHDRQMIRSEFERRVEDRFETIKREIESDLHAVVSLKAFFDSTRDVDRYEFRDFVEPHLSLLPSVQAIEWIPCVPRSGRMAFEAAARQQTGLSGFQITEPETQGKMVRAAEREQYFPVYFAEPYKSNRIALGFDVASNAMQKQALEKSRDTGEMVATGRIALGRETAGQFGFLVFAPVYRRDVTVDSIETRRENLKGFALGVFRIGEIVENSLTHLKPEGIDIYVYDKSAGSREESFLYFRPSRTGKTPLSSTLKEEAGPDGHLQNVKMLNFADRQWLILLRATPDFVGAGRTWQPLGVLAAGLLLAAVLAIYFILPKRANNSIEGQPDFLQTLIDTIPSPIFYKDAGGVYLGCNSAFEAYIGRPKSEVVGKTVCDIAPGELADVSRNADLALFNAPGIQQYDASVRYADGSLHDVIFSKAAFSDSFGKVAGIVGVMLDITGQKRAVDELEQTLAHLENVIENSPDSIAIVDKNGKFIRTNRMVAEHLGYTFEELRGKSSFDLYADKDELDRMLTKLRREGAVRKYAITMKKKDGATGIFEISISLLKDDANTVLGSVCVARDLSEIMNAMMALDNSNKRLEQEIFERRKIEEEIRRVNRFYDVLSQVNQAIVRIRSRDELLSTVCRLVVERGAVDLAWMGWLDPETFRISPVAHFGNQARMLGEAHFYAGGDSAGQGDAWRSIREGKPFVCNECDGRRCLYPAGQTPARFGFQSCGSFPFRFQGEVCGALTLCTAERGFFQKREIELLDEVTLDISFALDKIESDLQRDRLNEQYQEQSVFLRSLIDAMPCQVFYKDTQLRYLGCNRAYEQILGLDRDRIIGRTAHDIWPHRLADLYSRADRQLLADPDQQSVTHEVIVDTPEGVRRYYLTNKAIFRSQEGAVGGIIGSTTEITERRAAEAAIQKSEAKFRSYIENSPLAVLVVDREGRILDLNRSSLDLLGYDADTLEGMNLDKIVPDEDREMLLDDFAALFDKGHLQIERRLTRADGEVRWVDLNVSMIDDRHCLGYCQDITERKQAEKERTRIENQLRQAQKMEALGTLAGGIAHDFNNILGIIMGFTQLAMYESGQGPAVLDKLGEVLKAINRAKDLVKQILAFSRRSEQQKIPLQLGIIVKEAMQILRPSLPSTIEIETDVSTKANILADPTQMHQVLMNLCANAAHAMQDNGGILEVSLAEVLLGKENGPRLENLEPGRYVELTVRDTGHGIDPAIIDSIFDPFFTTKQLGEGTGLGLSVVHGILKSHGGCINVESTPGRGTEFTALIPVLETGYALDQTEADVPLPQGRERVLVVDDEPLLADMLKQMLENQGYDVVSRTSGLEALEAFRHHPAETPFDLVITDMTMPHFTGADLARELSAINPEVPVILTTGFSVKIDADRAKEMGIEGFLMKPVAMAELAAMVRTVLDRRKNPSSNAFLDR